MPKHRAERKISELPVVDANGCPAGLIDVTDVVGYGLQVVSQPGEAVIFEVDLDAAQALARKGDVGRLVVRALHQPDHGGQGEKLLEVQVVPELADVAVVAGDAHGSP